MGVPFFPLSFERERAVGLVQRLRERRARARQPLARGVRSDRQHRRRPRDLQPFHADQQQHLAVDVRQRREGPFEIAARGIVGGRRLRRAQIEVRRIARGDRDVGAPP